LFSPLLSGLPMAKNPKLSGRDKRN
jgi:hypothetical protein